MADLTADERRAARTRLTAELSRQQPVAVRNLNSGQIVQWFADTTAKRELEDHVSTQRKQIASSTGQVMGRVQRNRWAMDELRKRRDAKVEELDRIGRLRPGFVRWINDKEEAENEDGLGNAFGQGDASTGWLPPNVVQAKEFRADNLFAKGKMPLCKRDGSNHYHLSVGTKLYFSMLQHVGMAFLLGLFFAIPIFMLVRDGTHVRRDEMDSLAWSGWSLANIGQTVLSSVTQYTLPVVAAGEYQMTLPVERARTLAAARIAELEATAGTTVLGSGRVSNEAAIMVVAIMDAMICFMFMLLLIRFKHYMDATANIAGGHRKLLASDYTVLVRGLPATATADSVRDHFNARYDLQCKDWRERHWFWRRCRGVRPPLDPDPYAAAPAMDHLKPGWCNLRTFVRGSRNIHLRVGNVEHLRAHMPREQAERFLGGYVADVVLVQQNAELISRIFTLDAEQRSFKDARTLLMRYHPSSQWHDEMQYKRQQDSVHKQRLKLCDVELNVPAAYQPSTCAAFVTFNSAECLERCLEDYAGSTWWLGKALQPLDLQYHEDPAAAPPPTLAAHRQAVAAVQNLFDKDPNAPPGEDISKQRCQRLRRALRAAEGATPENQLPRFVADEHEDDPAVLAAWAKRPFIDLKREEAFVRSDPRILHHHIHSAKAPFAARKAQAGWEDQVAATADTMQPIPMDEYGHPACPEFEEPRGVPFQLSVERAPDPTDINWEHIEIEHDEQRLRAAGVWGMLTLIILLTVVVIAYAEGMEDAFEAMLPDKTMCQVHMPAAAAGSYDVVPLDMRFTRDKLEESDRCALGQYYLEYRPSTFAKGDRGIPDYCFGYCVTPGSPTVCALGIGTTDGAVCGFKTPSKCPYAPVDDTARRRSLSDGSPARKHTAQPEAKLASASATSTSTTTPRLRRRVASGPLGHLWQHVTAPLRPAVERGALWLVGQLPGPRRKLADATIMAHAEAAPKYTSDDLIDCFCYDRVLDAMSTGGLAAVSGLLSEYADSCAGFIGQFSSAKSFMVVSALIMVLVNALLEGSIESLTSWEGNLSISQAGLSQVRKLFITQFINTALVLTAINSTLPMFSGVYDDFTHGWYTNVGSQLVTALFFSMLGSHLPTLVVAGVCTPLRMWWWLEKEQHGTYSQQQLHDKVAPPEFKLQLRYATVLSNLTALLMFSTGFPILLLFGMIGTGLTLFVERLLVLRFYKQPPSFDQRIAEFSLRVLLGALLWHVAVSFWMLSAPGALASETWMGPDNMWLKLGTVMPQDASALGWDVTNSTTSNVVDNRLINDAAAQTGSLGVSLSFDLEGSPLNWFGLLPRIARVAALPSFLILIAAGIRAALGAWWCKPCRRALDAGAAGSCSMAQTQDGEDKCMLAWKLTSKDQARFDAEIETSNPPYVGNFFRMLPPDRERGMKPGWFGLACLVIGMPEMLAGICFNRRKIMRMKRWYRGEKKAKQKQDKMGKKGGKANSTTTTTTSSSSSSKRGQGDSSSDGEVGPGASTLADAQADEGGAEGRAFKLSAVTAEDAAAAAAVLGDRNSQAWFQAGAVADVPMWKPSKAHKLTRGQTHQGWRIVKHTSRGDNAKNRIRLWSDANEVAEAGANLRARVRAPVNGPRYTWELIAEYGLYSYDMQQNPLYAKAAQNIRFAQDQLHKLAHEQEREVMLVFEPHADRWQRLLNTVVFILLGKFFQLRRAVRGAYMHVRGLYIKHVLKGDPKAMENRGGTAGDVFVNQTTRPPNWEVDIEVPSRKKVAASRQPVDDDAALQSLQIAPLPTQSYDEFHKAVLPLEAHYLVGTRGMRPLRRVVSRKGGSKVLPAAAVSPATTASPSSPSLGPAAAAGRSEEAMGAAPTSAPQDPDSLASAPQTAGDMVLPGSAE